MIVQFNNNLKLRLISRAFMMATLMTTTTACAEKSTAKPQAPLPAKTAAPAQKAVQETRHSFFDLYQENRAQDRPNYITADFWLLAYSLIRNTTLADIEQKQLRPLFSSMLTDLSKSVKTDTEDSAQQANQDYLNILTALLTGKHELSSQRAQKELALIVAAQGIRPSPLWEMKIDYSQFKPRGRYSESAEDQHYFQAMRYASSVLFAVKASDATGVSTAMAERMTRQAILLTQAMKVNTAAAQLESLLAWQMGKADDLTTADLIEVEKSLKNPSQQAHQQALFDYARQQHKQPKILSAIVNVNQLEKDTTAADVLTGWRLIPLRYSTDNALFQQLLYPNTGNYENNGSQCPSPFGLSQLNGQAVKGYPSARELMALFNSPMAKSWVKAQCEDRFQRYPEVTEQAAKIIAQADGLNGHQIKLLQNWLSASGLNEAQATEHLTSGLGFWTWQRYTSLLYSKQSYSLTGKGISIPHPRPGAQLEKATELYQDLLAMVKQHQHYTPHPAWNGFAELLTTALNISAKTNDALSAQETLFLNDLDTSLLNYTGGLMDKPIIVDVHTHPGEGQVVEEGIGLAQVVKQANAWGARFSHHEFKQPLTERLDNEAWLKKLPSLAQPRITHQVR